MSCHRLALTLLPRDLSLPRARGGITLLMWLLCLLAGSGLQLRLYLAETEQTLEARSRQAVGLLDRMLSYANDTNRSLLDAPSTSCSRKVLGWLHTQVAAVPFVRTLGFNQRGLGCTSLVGVRNHPPLWEGARLSLLPAERVFQSRPLLVLRERRGERSVFSTIDGEYVRQMLGQASRDELQLWMRVGDLWFDGVYLFHVPPRAFAGWGKRQTPSRRYPFTLYAGYPEQPLWSALWKQRRFNLLLQLAFSCAMAWLTYWLLGRPRSPQGELARAMRAQEFVPYLQPLVESHSGQVVGAEVLMRWCHPAEGIIPPDQFIPQAEACGLIVPMTAQLMERVGEALAHCQHQLPRGFHLGVNITPRHFQESALPELCRRLLDRFEPDRISLILELTEGEELIDDAHTLSVLAQLRAMGVRLAIDDFGTGYSSLAYLQRFRVDYLKIDRSFVRHMGSESLSGHIVESVIDLARRLGLALVAEGVEREEQARFLRERGVGLLQGYLYGHPEPLSRFIGSSARSPVAADAGVASPWPDPDRPGQTIPESG